MSRPADVVVVGAGVIGASVAWHLASRDDAPRRIVVLERAPRAGTGSTAAATGGYRAQFSNAINVRLSLLAREKLRRFPEEVGGAPVYFPAGYLWLASSESERDALRSARRVQRECGLAEAEEVDPAAIARLQPAIALDGIVAGAFCPSDGYVKPLGVLSGYLDGAQRRGVEVLFDEEVRGFERDAEGRILAVATSRSRLPCGMVVNAAGAWAAEVARAAGIDLPVTPLRRQVGMTVPTTALPSGSPMTIWCEDGFHVRPREGRVLCAFPTPGDPADRWSLAVEPEWLAEVARRKDRRLPPLAGVPLDPAACWAGLYEMSPDKHALLGSLPACPNLVFVNGSSGHGVMHAPALGQLAAEIVTEGRARALDVAALDPGRFAAGRPNPPELL